MKVFLIQLQEMVEDMKDGFKTAMDALTQIQYGDQSLQDSVCHGQTECEDRLSGVIQMVLSLKVKRWTQNVHVRWYNKSVV